MNKYSYVIRLDQINHSISSSINRKLKLGMVVSLLRTNVICTRRTINIDLESNHARNYTNLLVLVVVADEVTLLTTPG